MSNVIYAKFSNDRFEKFRIKTFILEDENEERYVEKHAASIAATEHIANIKNKGMLLEQQFQDSVFRINKIKEHTDYLVFEYVEGETLEQILNYNSANGDWGFFYSIIDEYCTHIRKLATQEFVITTEFIEVFGKRSFDKSLKSCVVTDIDLIFSNIVINDGWNVLDYEWSFDFPIPVDYIIYRALSNTKELNDLNLFSKYGISDKMLIEFKQMEECFGNYVGYRQTINHYKKICKTISFHDLLNRPTQDEYEEINNQKNEIELHGQKLEEILSDARSDIQMLQERHQKDLQELNEYHQKDLDEYKMILDEARSDIQMLQERHQRDLQELKEYHQADIQTLMHHHQGNIDALTHICDEKEKELQEKSAEFEHVVLNLNDAITALEKEKVELISQNTTLLAVHNEINNSLSWKVTKPFRSIANSLKQLFH